jgi:hypothetical protein
VRTCRRQTLPVTRNFVTSPSNVLNRYFTTGYTLLNASRTATKISMQCSRMNTCSAREYAMFVLHSFCPAGVSSGLETRMTFTRVSRERLGDCYTEGGPAFDFIFLPLFVIVFGLRFKWYTLYLFFPLSIHLVPWNLNTMRFKK